jgi:hypothetical protein
MKTRIVFLGSLGVAMTILLNPSWQAIGQDDPINPAGQGVVTYVQGSVKKKPPQSQQWLRALEKTEIYSGEKVRTFEESRAEMELRELDIIRLAPNTTIDIVKLYEETKEQRDEIQIDVEQGDLWALVDDVAADASFDINSPVTGSAITGTKLRINVCPDSSTLLKVYTGEVKITNVPHRTGILPKTLPKIEPQRGQAPGTVPGPGSVPGPTNVQGPRSVTLEEWVYIVKNMQQISVNSRGQVTAAGDFSRDDPDEQSDWVKWNQQRDRLMGR